MRSGDRGILVADTLYKEEEVAYAGRRVNNLIDLSGCRALLLTFCLSKSQPPATVGSGAIAMTAKQAAVELQVSLSFVYKLTDQGEIAFEWRGCRKLLVEKSVADYKRRNLVPATPGQHKPVKGPANGFKHLFNNEAGPG